MTTPKEFSKIDDVVYNVDIRKAKDSVVRDNNIGSTFQEGNQTYKGFCCKV